MSALGFKFIICKMASLNIQRQGKGLLIGVAVCGEDEDKAGSELPEIVLRGLTWPEPLNELYSTT